MIGRLIALVTLLGAVATLPTSTPGSVKWGSPAPSAYQSGASQHGSVSWGAPAPDRIWAPPGTGLQLIIPRDPR